MQATDRPPPQPRPRSRPSSATAADDPTVTQIALAALNLLPVAVLAVESDLTVRFRNAAAARLAARGDLPGATPGETLRLARRADTARLVGLVPVIAAGGPPAGVRLEGAEDGDRLFCLLRPLPAEPPAADLLVLLTLHPRRCVPATDPAELAGLFDLSPAEATILRALAAGQSADDIAAARGRSLATIRTQIRNVLRKLECPTILDAVLLLARLGA